jgi:hypothetical protein
LLAPALAAGDFLTADLRWAEDLADAEVREAIGSNLFAVFWIAVTKERRRGDTS